VASLSPDWIVVAVDAPSGVEMFRSPRSEVAENNADDADVLAALHALDGNPVALFYLPQHAGCLYFARVEVGAAEASK
jgi:hypothetical protein